MLSAFELMVPVEIADGSDAFGTLALSALKPNLTLGGGGASEYGITTDAGDRYEVNLPANHTRDTFEVSLWFVPKFASNDGVLHTLAEIELDANNRATIQKLADGTLQLTTVTGSGLTKTAILAPGTPWSANQAVFVAARVSAVTARLFFDTNNDGVLEGATASSIGGFNAGTYTVASGADIGGTHAAPGSYCLLVTNAGSQTPIDDRYNAGAGKGVSDWLYTWRANLVLYVGGDATTARLSTFQGATDAFSQGTTGRLDFSGSSQFVDYGNRTEFNAVNRVAAFLEAEKDLAANQGTLLSRWDTTDVAKQQFQLGFGLFETVALSGFKAALAGEYAVTVDAGDQLEHVIPANWDGLGASLSLWFVPQFASNDGLDHTILEIKRSGTGENLRIRKKANGDVEFLSNTNTGGTHTALITPTTPWVAGTLVWFDFLCLNNGGTLNCSFAGSGITVRQTATIGAPGTMTAGGTWTLAVGARQGGTSEQAPGSYNLLLTTDRNGTDATQRFAAGLGQVVGTWLDTWRAQLIFYLGGDVAGPRTATYSGALDALADVATGTYVFTQAAGGTALLSASFAELDGKTKCALAVKFVASNIAQTDDAFLAGVYGFGPDDATVLALTMRTAGTISVVIPTNGIGGSVRASSVIDLRGQEVEVLVNYDGTQGTDALRLSGVYRIYTNGTPGAWTSLAFTFSGSAVPAALITPANATHPRFSVGDCDTSYGNHLRFDGSIDDVALLVGDTIPNGIRDRESVNHRHPIWTHWWPMSGNATDQRGTVNLTVTNGVQITDGRNGVGRMELHDATGSYRFPVGGYITLGNWTELDGRAAWTMYFPRLLLGRSRNGLQDQGIFTRYAGTDATTKQLAITQSDDGRIRVWIGDRIVFSGRAGTEWAALEGDLVDLRVVYDGSQATDATKVRIYAAIWDITTGKRAANYTEITLAANGPGSIPATMPTPGSSVEARFGSTSGVTGSGNYFTGAIDEARVNVSVALANGTGDGIYSQATGSWDRIWRFDGNANDTSGVANGTVTGAVSFPDWRHPTGWTRLNFGTSFEIDRATGSAYVAKGTSSLRFKSLVGGGNSAVQLGVATAAGQLQWLGSSIREEATDVAVAIEGAPAGPVLNAAGAAVTRYTGTAWAPATGTQQLRVQTIGSGAEGYVDAIDAVIFVSVTAAVATKGTNKLFVQIGNGTGLVYRGVAAAWAAAERRRVLARVDLTQGTDAARLKIDTSLYDPTTKSYAAWVSQTLTITGTAPATLITSTGTPALRLGSTSDGLFCFDGKIDTAEWLLGVAAPDAVRDSILGALPSPLFDHAYVFDGDANDLLGSVNGTVTGATYVDDGRGYAGDFEKYTKQGQYSFDGVTANITHGNYTPLNGAAKFALDLISVSGDLTGSGPNLVERGQLGSDGQLTIRKDDGALGRLAVYLPASGAGTESGTWEGFFTLAVPTWIRVEYDGTQSTNATRLVVKRSTLDVTTGIWSALSPVVASAFSGSIPATLRTPAAGTLITVGRGATGARPAKVVIDRFALHAGSLPAAVSPYAFGGTTYDIWADYNGNALSNSGLTGSAYNGTVTAAVQWYDGRQPLSWAAADASECDRATAAADLVGGTFGLRVKAVVGNSIVRNTTLSSAAIGNLVLFAAYARETVADILMRKAASGAFAGNKDGAIPTQGSMALCARSDFAEAVGTITLQFTAGANNAEAYVDGVVATVFASIAPTVATKSPSRVIWSASKNGAALPYFALALNGSEAAVAVILDASNVRSVAGGNTTLPLGWHTIGMSFDGTTLKVYHDATAEATTVNPPAGSFATLDSTTIGALRLTSAGNQYTGKIGRAMQWNRVLSAAERARAHNGLRKDYPTLAAV